ncbi:hypothetical protein GYMLUDRAFT_36721 [Collybiopsis luxurians FD-317 M1]|nr:hypothetical protein GYMLUDRAFT_36721 [Collybiopsis luxurians FD-317 M1]
MLYGYYTPSHPRCLYSDDFRTVQIVSSVLVIVTTAATALEVFDFPPWQRAVETHALWHLATVPVSLAWYCFFIRDANDSSWKHDRR